MLLTPVLFTLALALPARAANSKEATRKADAAYQFTLARLATSEGSYAEAMQAFDEAIRLAPDDAYIRVEMANLLARLGRFTVSPDERNKRFSRAAAQAKKAAQLAPTDFDVLFEVGHVYMNFADQDESWAAEAIRVFEGAREQRPDDPRVLLPLGQLYLDADQHAEAVDALRTVWNIVPGNAMAEGLYREALGLLVTQRMREGESREAESLLAEILALESTSVQARISLADLQAQRGDHAEAVETLRAGLDSKDPDAATPELRQRLAYELYLSGSIEEAADLIDALLEEEFTTAGGLKVLLLAVRGRQGEALAELQALSDRTSERVALAATVARLMDRDGFGEEAVALLAGLGAQLEAADDGAGARAVSLELAQLHAGQERWQQLADLLSPILAEPGSELDAPLRLLYAEALTQLDRSDEALGVLPEGTEGPFLVKRAETLMRMGRDQEGERLLDRLSQADGSEGALQAALVYQRLERYEEAVELLEGVVEADGESGEGRYYLASAYERAGRIEDSKKVFRELLKAQPDFAPALNYLGYMLAERGERLDEALRMINKAVAIDPDNGAYVDSLGWIHFQRGDLARAREYLERASRLVPGDPTIHEHLGDVYTALGDENLARDFYRRALVLDAETEGGNAEQLRKKLADLGADSQQIQ